MVYGGYVDADGNAASNTVDNSTDPLEVVEFMLITLIPTPNPQSPVLAVSKQH